MNKLFNVNNLVFLIVLLLIAYGCKNAKNINFDESSESTDASNGLSANEAMVYSLPSPYQVSSLIKIAGIDYEKNIIEMPMKHSNLYSSPEYKSLNLGASLVDLYYTTIFEEYPTSAVFLQRVDELMYESGMKSVKFSKFANRIENNLDNKDSLYHYIGLYQQQFEDYYSVSDEKQKTFLIVSGVYIEGLYLLSEMYQNSFYTKSLTPFMEKSLNTSILQQAIFLDNLIELLESFNDPKIEPFVLRFKTLQNLFTTINIEYSLGKKNEIQQVKLLKKHMFQIHEIAKVLREDIILERI
ncbi:MAG TPA: hypothetical protein DDX39_09890 [Bacteroidales bacterium]|nr:MAG: hypothetical protein A2W98_01485 [Bacteroidetes bacterium GWF2_33_38]OFY85995.1 MAG: hypothetical protein A2236_10830 [Bacteroidetes bacterium RIFOXYA2_FULL_33_7]HBF88940.1 hypothetical protein [Bacteroidales bacterium]